MKLFEYMIIIIVFLFCFIEIVDANIVCNDGTISPSCTTCSRGCCSRHQGCSNSSYSKPKKKTTTKKKSSNSGTKAKKTTTKKSKTTNSKKNNNTTKNTKTDNKKSVNSNNQVTNKIEENKDEFSPSNLIIPIGVIGGALYLNEKKNRRY